MLVSVLHHSLVDFLAMAVWARSIRESKAFTLIVVCIAIFSDVFTYGILVPVVPFALTERLGVHDADVQKWNSILLGVLGVAILVGGSMRISTFTTSHGSGPLNR